MRSPACATLTERRLPWLISTLDLPSALLTPGRSIAMRGGAWTVKPAGTAASGSRQLDADDLGAGLLACC